MFFSMKCFRQTDTYFSSPPISIWVPSDTTSPLAFNLRTIVAFLPQWQTVLISFRLSAQARRYLLPSNRLPWKSVLIPKANTGVSNSSTILPSWITWFWVRNWASSINTQSTIDFLQLFKTSLYISVLLENIFDFALSPIRETISPFPNLLSKSEVYILT